MKNLKLAVLTAFLFVAVLCAISQEIPTPFNSGSVTGVIINDTDSLKVNDKIIAYFGENYICGASAVINEQMIERGFVFTVFNNKPAGDGINDLNGVQIDSVFNLGLIRGGVIYKINTNELKAGQLVLRRVTDMQISKNTIDQLKQVPYLTELNNKCPEVMATTINAGNVAAGDGVIIQNFTPKYCKSFEFEVEKGGGNVFKDGLSTWRYKVSPDDLQSGEVELTLKVTPFDGCDENTFYFSCVIIIEKQAPPAQLTKADWYVLAKKISIQKSGDQVTLTGPKNIDYPRMTIRLYAGKPGQPPRKKDEITSTAPEASFTLPEGYSQGYVKIITEQGYTWNYKF